MSYALMSLSLRKDSFNTRQIHLVSEVLKKENVDHRILDLNDYPLVAFSQDLEAVMPDSANRLKADIEKSTALIISSPEYNYSIPGHFKNTFDWLSRYNPMPWKGKCLLLMSASISLVGGNRGLWAIRIPFEATGTIVYPDMFSLATAQNAFDEKGQLKDKSLAERLNTNVRQFVSFVEKII